MLRFLKTNAKIPIIKGGIAKCFYGREKKESVGMQADKVARNEATKLANNKKRHMIRKDLIKIKKIYYYLINY